MSPRIKHHEQSCDTKPGLASRKLSGEQHLTIRPITDTFSSPWKPRRGVSLIVEVGALATLGVRNEDADRVETGLTVRTLQDDHLHGHEQVPNPP